MENTNMQNQKEKAGCPCMEINKKYAKSFNDDDLTFEEEIDFEEMPAPSKKNKN